MRKQDRTFYQAFVEDMFKEYLEFSENEKYAHHHGVLHAAVGLAAEAAEVLDELKKVVFTAKTYDRDTLIEEMGDVEFYMQALRNVIGVTRDDVLNANILKLEKRHPDGFKKSDYYMTGDK